MPSIAQASLSGAERRVLERFIERLAQELGDELHAVWLYGSRARGERPGPDSDVDLLILTSGGRGRDTDRVWGLLREAGEDSDEPTWDFMLKVGDPDWLRHRRQIHSFFIEEVDRDKIVLAGDL